MHYQDLGSARHQYGISAVVTQTSFCESSSGDLVKRRLFSQANSNHKLLLRIKIYSEIQFTGMGNDLWEKVQSCLFHRVKKTSAYYKIMGTVLKLVIQ